MNLPLWRENSKASWDDTSYCAPNKSGLVG